MSKDNRPLSETNPYLQDFEQRERLIRRSVETSNAVEGIYVKLNPKLEFLRKGDITMKGITVEQYDAFLEYLEARVVNPYQDSEDDLENEEEEE